MPDSSRLPCREPIICAVAGSHLFALDLCLSLALSPGFILGRLSILGFNILLISLSFNALRRHGIYDVAVCTECIMFSKERKQRQCTLPERRKTILTKYNFYTIPPIDYFPKSNCGHHSRIPTIDQLSICFLRTLSTRFK